MNKGEKLERNMRKVLDGTVVSNSMDKTAVVKVTSTFRHPVYKKVVHKDKTYYVHDEENTLNEGDRVRIMETRPLSKLKRWRLVDVLIRAGVVETKKK